MPSFTSKFTTAFTENTECNNLRYIISVLGWNQVALAEYLSHKIKEDDFIIKKEFDMQEEINYIYVESCIPHVLSAYGYTDTIDKLINEGVDFDTRDALGMTPLFWAIIGRHQDVIELLIKKARVNPSVVSEYTLEFSTPLEAAIYTDDEFIVQYLLDHGTKREPVIQHKITSNRENPLKYTEKHVNQAIKKALKLKQAGRLN